MRIPVKPRLITLEESLDLKRGGTLAIFNNLGKTSFSVDDLKNNLICYKHLV